MQHFKSSTRNKKVAWQCFERVSCVFHQFHYYNSLTPGLHFSVTQLKWASYMPVAAAKLHNNFSKCNLNFKALSIIPDTEQRTFTCILAQCLAHRKMVGFDKDFLWWVGWGYQKFWKDRTKVSQLILNLTFKISHFETFMCLLSLIPQIQIVWV